MLTVTEQETAHSNSSLHQITMLRRPKLMPLLILVLSLDLEIQTHRLSQFAICQEH